VDEMTIFEHLVECKHRFSNLLPVLYLAKVNQSQNLDQLIDSKLYFENLVSISPTFYEQLLHQNPFAKKLETQIVST
jgi:hypothetical protein